MYQLTSNEGLIVRVDDGAQIPCDADNSDYQAYLLWVGEGNVAAPAPPPDLQALVVALVQERLDGFARTRGYESIFSACTYAASGNPRFKAEGQYCVDARDAHWGTLYQLLADVQGGLRPVPTLEEVMAELPALEWPQ